MFDLEKMALSSTVAIAATDVTIQDARTGEVKKITFYRPGRQFPTARISRELAQYGYTIVKIDEPGCVEGPISWNDLFGALIQQETK